MSIPPDFTRRVQENPQIAVELYEALEIADAMLREWVIGRQLTLSGFRRMRRITNAIESAGVSIAQTHAHYANELALDAAERTGEEPLDEHVRCVPGMGD